MTLSHFRSLLLALIRTKGINMNVEEIQSNTKEALRMVSFLQSKLRNQEDLVSLIQGMISEDEFVLIKGYVAYSDGDSTEHRCYADVYKIPEDQKYLSFVDGRIIVNPDAEGYVKSGGGLFEDGAMDWDVARDHSLQTLISDLDSLRNVLDRCLYNKILAVTKTAVEETDYDSY